MSGANGYHAPGNCCQELLRQNPSMSGWLRRKSPLFQIGEKISEKFQGVEKLSKKLPWERQFVVLHQKYLYIYSSETSSKPEKTFSMKNFVQVVSEPNCATTDVPWPFKLIGSDSNHKDEYFSSSSDSDLQKWLSAIEAEISAPAAEYRGQSRPLPTAPVDQSRPQILNRTLSMASQSTVSSSYSMGSSVDNRDSGSSSDSGGKLPPMHLRTVPPVPASGTRPEPVPMIERNPSRPSKVKMYDNQESGVASQPVPSPRSNRSVPDRPLPKQPSLHEPTSPVQSKQKPQPAIRPKPKQKPNQPKENEDDQEDYEQPLEEGAMFDGSKKESEIMMKNLTSQNGIFMIRSASEGKGKTLLVTYDNTVLKYPIQYTEDNKWIICKQQFITITELLCHFRKNAFPNKPLKLTTPFSDASPGVEYVLND